MLFTEYLPFVKGNSIICSITYWYHLVLSWQGKRQALFLLSAYFLPESPIMENKQKHRILIVDDRQDNIKVLGALLAQEEYLIHAAQNGVQASEVIKHITPDLILLDIMMPEMDGYELCRRLKNDSMTSDIPVIFISAKSEIEDEKRGLELGAADYITKPFSHAIVKARVKTQLALYEQNRRLVELNRLKDRFLAMAAHDLRNPLTIIKSFSELLLGSEGNAELNPKHKDYISTINNASSGLISLLNNLLDITTIESGKFHMDFKKGDIEPFIRERIEINRLNANKKNIVINEELFNVPDLFFDRDRINQVLDNLLSNAIKFSPKGSTVHVFLYNKGRKVFVNVRDEGPGISEENQPKLFGEFQKVGTKTTGGEKSTGLGLSIVKKIIEMHKGEINVVSTPGAGAEFIFSLPLS